ncbi:MAG: hypothetical protein ISEC1_P1070 [Thiomicrorhabdus sp.]|nr:MAG: hypothetical protein ISEC1_P1070 [Thiomicrorhabdus sp.]
MKNMTQKIENKLGQLGGVIASSPKLFIVFIMLIVVLFASNLPKTTIDTSTEGFLHETAKSRLAYDEFRNQFGRDEKIVVAIKTADVFSLESLKKLQGLHKELSRKVPHLNDITSLINARNTRGEGNNLLVDDLFQQWPSNQSEADALKQQALDNPLYQNILVNEESTFTVIILESNTYSETIDADGNKIVQSAAAEDDLDLEGLELGFDDEVTATTADNRPFITDEENTEMVNAVTEIVSTYNSSGFEVYVAGSPSVTAFLKKSIMGDMQKFVVMIVVATAILLSLLFRRASGVILPLITVVLAVVSTMGLMAYTSTPIKVMTQVLPSFLLAVGVGASIHVLAIFFKHFDMYGDKAEAIKHTLSHSGLAIIMTSLTTAAGMASFAPSEVAPVADLGVFSALGVLISLMFTLILLPALLMVFNIKRKVIDPDAEHHDKLDEYLKAIADFSQDHAKKIVVASLIFMAISIGLASKINYSHNPLLWFPESHETRIATEVIDKEMRGSISIELVIDTGVENGLYDLKVLKAIEKITDEIMLLEGEDYFVGKAISVVDVIKEINKALNYNDPKFSVLPNNSNLISQEILLFENSGSEDLEDFVDSQFSKARITVKAPWIDAFKYHELLNKTADLIEEHINAEVEQSVGHKIHVTTTGMIPLLAETISAAISSSGVSYLLAFVIIAVMLIMLLSSVSLGLLSMIPNLLPIFFVLAVMVLFSFPLDLFTMLIGVIVIGIAVDDIVHFMHNFRRYHLQGVGTRKAVEMTLTTSGRAMIITTIVLLVGFMLYLFASMSNLFLFGLLTALAFVVALIAVFLLAPALMALKYPDEENAIGKADSNK